MLKKLYGLDLPGPEGLSENKISNSLDIIRQCDRIITMEKGQIIESGTHATLLAEGGRYAALHKRQSGFGDAL